VQVKVKVIPAPDDLKRDVECFRVTAHSRVGGLAINVVPKALPGIVFQHQEGRSAIDRIVTPSRILRTPTLFLHGAVTEPGVMHYAAGSYTTIQVILKPYALKSLFGMNAEGLAREPVELNELSAGDLNAQMIEATDVSGKLGLLTRFLYAHLKRAHTRDELVEAALNRIHARAATVSVRSLLRDLSISERQFERRFSQTVGVPPQSYIRVTRLNEAIRLIKTGRYERLTDIAHALGYYDQSHFIRDVKALSGVTPKAISERAIDSYHDQLGYSYL
jgi:AraC-like DNA-binding protein